MSKKRKKHALAERYVLCNPNKGSDYGTRKR